METNVTDFGPGIDEERLDRIFQPIITTREEGMGMGLTINRPSSRRMAVACGRKAAPSRAQNFACPFLWHNEGNRYEWNVYLAAVKSIVEKVV